MKLCENKKGLILGLANDKSIAWGIARAAHEHGAELAFTYQGDALLKRVKPLAESCDAKIIEPCDITNENDLKRVFDKIEQEWGQLDFVIHAIAYSDKDELKGAYLNTSRDNFLKTMEISAYSLVNVARYARNLLSKNGGSITTLSYFGSEKVMPNYNVMGVAKAALECSVQYLAADLGRENIRVNAISAGPIRTLAASGIADFRLMLKWSELNAPLRRNVTIDDVGNAGLYLISDLSSAVTGEIMHVDSGYNIMGMVAEDTMADSGQLLTELKGSKS